MRSLILGIALFCKETTDMGIAPFVFGKRCSRFIRSELKELDLGWEVVIAILAQPITRLGAFPDCVDLK